MILREYLRDIDQSRSEHYPHIDFVCLAEHVGVAMQAYDEHHALLAAANRPKPAWPPPHNLEVGRLWRDVFLGALQNKLSVTAAENAATTAAACASMPKGTRILPPPVKL